MSGAGAMTASGIGPAAGDPPRDLLVGIDVGGTKIAAIAAAPGGRLVGRSVRPVPADASRDLIDVLGECVAEVAEDADRVRAVGVVFPGRIDRDSGHVRSAVNLAWVDQPVGPRLSARLGRPCVVENDVRAAALGVQRYGGALAAPDMAYLNVGTGIAAGIVIGGRLHRGPRGMAGEVGHIVADPTGAVCGCGLPGCAEALASGRAIEREALRQVPPAVLAAHRDRAGHTTAALYAAAAAGDPAAEAVVRDVSAVLARTVHGLVMAYDLERVVIGGGVARIGAPFLAGIEAALDEFRARSALAVEVLPAGLLRLVPPDFDAGCWGAVALADDVGGPTADVAMGAGARETGA